MATTRAVVLATLIVCCGLTIAPVAVALEGGFAGIGGDGSDDDPDDSRPMGAEVSAFMQSTATDSSSSVDRRMFVGAYETADEDDRESVIADRTDQLEERLAALEAEMDELEAQKDELNPVAYDARMSRLAVQISNLERAIDDAEHRAVEVGADTERLELLRNEAANASGPEVAAAAQGLAGIDPPRGPPDHVGERGGGSPADDEERGGGPPADDEERGGGPPADDEQRGGGPPAGDETDREENATETDDEQDGSPDDRSAGNAGVGAPDGDDGDDAPSSDE